MSDPTTALPASARFVLPALRRQMAQIAARGLVIFSGSFAALLTLASLAEMASKGSAGNLAGDRLLLGLIIAAGAALGWLTARRGHPKAASTLMVSVIALGLALHGWMIGLGLYTTALAGLCLLVAVAGMLLGMRVALALAAGHALIVGLLAWAEAAGWIQGRAALAALPLVDRVIGHALLGMGGLLAALLLHRLVTQVIRDAVIEQQRLSQLLSIGIDWTWEMDTTGRITQLSPSFETATGRTVAEFMQLGQPGGPQVVRDAGFDAWFDDVKAGRAYRDRVVTMRCADGTLLHVQGNGRPLLDRQGRIERWIGVSRNVTREVAAERERQRTQAMLDRMIMMSPDAISVARPDGRFLLVNTRFEELAGVPAAEFIGRRPDQLGLWTKAESIRLRDAITEAGVLRDFRSIVTPRNGPPRLLSITGAAFDWHGEPVAVITARDITDIERAKIEGDAILDHASVGIALVRAQRFERVNPRLCQMLGRSAQELVGHATAVIFDDRADFERFLAERPPPEKLAEGADFEREFKRGDNGQRVRLRLHARGLDPMRDLDSGTIWVAEDVTERHRFERELADAKQQAEAASRAKSDFLATMSHEIRTPLNGVLGLAKLLQNPELEASLRDEYLGHLVQSASQLEGIVSNVLDLSKIEAGRLLLEVVPFDLHELLANAFDGFAALCRERGLQMRLSLASGLPLRVRGDPLRLRQILANYLGNALKFTERGSISLEASPAGTGRVRFTVQDSGIGVPASLKPLLFHPFSQADSSTTRRFGGTGLGLSICRELATRMGGRVGLDSEGTEGSRFWVELPLPSDTAAATATETPHAAQGQLHGRLLLVAEDNTVNLLIVRAMLERHGARVLEAADGQEAVQLARRHAGELHAVLMDLHMPRLDGLAATRALRAEAATAALPILAFSAAVLDQERRAAVAAGMNGFVAKPVDETELLRVLAQLPGQSRSAGAGSGPIPDPAEPASAG
jgi:PAS domain S-box-containing protein